MKPKCGSYPHTSGCSVEHEESGNSSSSAGEGKSAGASRLLGFDSGLEGGVDGNPIGFDGAKLKADGRVARGIGVLEVLEEAHELDVSLSLVEGELSVLGGIGGGVSIGGEVSVEVSVDIGALDDLTAWDITELSALLNALGGDGSPASLGLEAERGSILDNLGQSGDGSGAGVRVNDGEVLLGSSASGGVDVGGNLKAVPSGGVGNLGAETVDEVLVPERGSLISAHASSEISVELLGAIFVEGVVGVEGELDLGLVKEDSGDSVVTVSTSSLTLSGGDGGNESGRESFEHLKFYL